MAIKKSEIYGDLWKSCDLLRGGMDASQYKDYILSILFVKYISDKYTGKKDSSIIIPTGASFQDMVALKGTSEIGTGINEILKKIAEANEMHGIIDVEDIDFDDDEKLGSGKAKVDRLSKIIGIFQRETLDFSKNRSDGDDLIGDAYEYLMRNFATQSGKSKGQFYTPSEVSQVIAKVIGAKNAKRKDWTVYDPTAGSGSLLLKVANETIHGITIYGQENDVATRAMAMMNMWIHNFVDAEIKRENTIANPLWIENNSLKEFDFVVSNPPFSFKTWSTGIDPSNDEFDRFSEYGIPPTSNGDYAFLLHVLKSMKNNSGKGAIILPHGVLFRPNAESTIRKNLVLSGYIKGIIGLPPNLFYGTPIPASIIILDKENADNRKEIFMIDASKGFVKDGNKNRLRARDIHEIINIFINQLEIENYSRLVPHSEISNKQNDYNLNISRFIESREENNIQDIEAHLKGGIPSKEINIFDDFWKLFPILRSSLFIPSERKNYEKLGVKKSTIKDIIFESDECKHLLLKIKKSFDDWKIRNRLVLTKIKKGDDPKQIILNISDDILNTFSKFELIDKYDIYQSLMNYWEEVMQDDLYLVSQNGWDLSIIIIKDKNDKEKDWNSELIPKNIISKRYFSEKLETLEELDFKLQEITQKMEILEEENEGEDDLFAKVRNDSEKIAKPAISKRLKEIKNVSDLLNEEQLLTKYSLLMEKQTNLRTKIRLIQKKLDDDLRQKCSILSIQEIKDLVIDDKWLHILNNSINKEFEKIFNILAGRLLELENRYEKTLPEIENNVKLAAKEVDQHMKNMGFKW
jgi:type I restriction enzyme M protein